MKTTENQSLPTDPAAPSIDEPEVPGLRELRERLVASNAPGSHYEPELTAVHSRSHGYVYRVPGIKTGRVHHLLSRLEYHALLFFDFSPDYTNIREQFALPLALTMHMAKRLGIRHPHDWQKRQLTVMTTDFVLSTKDGRWMAIDVKPSKKLKSGRVLRKLDLVRKTWALVGIQHAVVTEKEQPVIAANNYRILHGLALPFDPPPLPESDLNRAEASMRASLSAGRLTLRDAACACEREAGLGVGRCIRAALWFVARRRWIVDLNRPIGPDEPLTFIA